MTYKLNRRTVLRTGTAALATPLIAGRARAQGTPLRFTQFYAPGGEVPAQVAWFENLVASWNATHEQQVLLEYVPAGDYMGGRLTTLFATGEGPDIFLLSPGDFLRYLNGGALADISQFVPDIVKADFSEGVLASRMVGDRIYGIPMEVEPMAMYYSVRAFEDAGLNESDLPSTWDDMLSLGGRLTTDDRYGLLFDTNPGFYQNFTWYPWFWQAGGAFQNADGGSAFGSPAAEAALGLWQNAVALGAAPRQILGGGGWDIVPNLGSGFAAMQNCGVWGIAALQDAMPDEPFGVFPMPTPEGGAATSVGGGWAFCANARGGNPEAAAEFCAWALASEDPASSARMVDWCTVAKTNIPPRASALEAGAEALQSGQMATFTNEILPTVRAEPRMPPEVYSAISDAIQAAMLGGTAPAEAAATASDRIDAFLATYDGAPIL
ncbi:MAG: sugar ABC transporter substrate-binding protein [Pseudomonadota bacterium]